MEEKAKEIKQLQQQLEREKQTELKDLLQKRDQEEEDRMRRVLQEREDTVLALSQRIRTETATEVSDRMGRENDQLRRVIAEVTDQKNKVLALLSTGNYILVHFVLVLTWQDTRFRNISVHSLFLDL